MLFFRIVRAESPVPQVNREYRMFKYLFLTLAVVWLVGCGGEQQYKDDPVMAAQIKARKEKRDPVFED